MNHLVLLGDSILDNAAYTAGGPTVLAHLQALLPADWKVSMLAVDGSVTDNVINQLALLPTDTTHLVVSAGGNNALLQSDFVSDPAKTVADALSRMSAIAQQFALEYETMLKTILARGLPTTLCTVYDPNFTEAPLQQIMQTALVIFNDIILRQAIRAGFPVIDLRQVCTSSEDYANAIEPSVAGGAKIAATIIKATTAHDFSTQRTTVYH